MAKFFLVDHSLTQVGGHHYDYVRLIAQAADALGLETVIGTHHDFNPNSTLDRIATLSPVFRDTTYSKYSLLAGLREITRASKFATPPRQGIAGPFDRWRNWSKQKRLIQCRSAHVRRFAEDCDRLFSDFELQDKDQVFLVTASELDFMGLAAFLANHPRTLQVTWHIQFHFSMLQGRPPQYDQQRELQQAVTDCFHSALARVPYHDIKCYSTSDELAIQYNRMRLIPFDPLPYPIDPQLFEQQCTKPPHEPIQITVAGGVRREKGQKTYLSELINQIWSRHLEPGQLQLNIQCHNRRWMTRKKLFACDQQPIQQSFDRAIQVVDHPLSEDDYLRLIEQSDIGLLFYDSNRYYSRRAGILGEFLAAGKPVIVPAGCWLSEQIAESIFQHVEHLVESASRVETIELTDTDWSHDNVPMPGAVITFDQQQHPFVCRLRRPDDQRLFAVQFNWHWQVDGGNYCRIDAKFFDENSRQIGNESQILGMRQDAADALALFQLPKDSVEIEVQFTNSYIDRTISLCDVDFHFFNPVRGGQSVPIGAVGVIVSDPQSLSSAVSEIVDHYEHYLTTAVDFAQTWASQHDPMRTLDFLIDDTPSLRRAA